MQLAVRVFISPFPKATAFKSSLTLMHKDDNSKRKAKSKALLTSVEFETYRETNHWSLSNGNRDWSVGKVVLFSVFQVDISNGKP